MCMKSVSTLKRFWAADVAQCYGFFLGCLMSLVLATRTTEKGVGTKQWPYQMLGGVPRRSLIHYWWEWERQAH